MSDDPAASDAASDAAPEPAVAPVRWRLGFLLWLAGMLGVAAFALLPLPRQLVDGALAVPLWVIQVVGLVQSALTLAIAVAIGVRLAPRVGLHAPAFEALVARGSVVQALLPQLIPALVGGTLGAAVLLAFDSRAPAEIDAVVASGFAPPLLARVLYGGITEELLLRWGVMSLLLWLGWRVVQRGRSRPHPAIVACAIVASAIVFGLGHLPTVVAFGGELTHGVVLYVVLGNALFGSVAGLLFWRYGLEAAMLGHALAHLFALAL